MPLEIKELTIKSSISPVQASGQRTDEARLVKRLHELLRRDLREQVEQALRNHPTNR